VSILESDFSAFLAPFLAHQPPDQVDPVANCHRQAESALIRPSEVAVLRFGFLPRLQRTVFFLLCSDLLPLGLLLLILLVVLVANPSDSGLHAKLLPTT